MLIDIAKQVEATVLKPGQGEIKRQRFLLPASCGLCGYRVVQLWVALFASGHGGISPVCAPHACLSFYLRPSP